MNSQEPAKLLADLEDQLRKQGEGGWIRGVIAANHALLQFNDVEQAKSIITSMSQGANSFANYSIWASDLEARIKLNAPIDRLRKEFWTACDL